MLERTILHCDLNGFYASVECLFRPELREVPMAVAGDPESRRGIILAKNELAKRAGVVTAETIQQARRKCPGLTLVRPRHSVYAAYSKKVNAVYLRYTDRVEPFGIDESYLDLTGIYGQAEGSAVADQIRRTVRGELGLTISAGVSFCKTFAKLGSDLKKPDATTCIPREAVERIVWPLAVSRLLFVGKKTAETLRRLEVCTIGELAAADPELLHFHLGKAGRRLWESANGLDTEPVRAWADRPPIESVGNGLTYRRNLVGLSDIRPAVLDLSQEVAYRMRKHGVKCRTVGVAIRDPQFKTISRQTTRETPTYLASELAETALELIEKTWNLKAPIRMLTITGMNLVAEAEAFEQLDLLDGEAASRRDKRERLERTMAGLRDKYGRDVLSTGGILESDLGLRGARPPEPEDT